MSFNFMATVTICSDFGAPKTVSPSICHEVIGLDVMILIPGCASSSLVFHMMYSAYKLNKQGDNIQS